MESSQEARGSYLENRRQRAVKGFYIHFIVFVCVMTGLLALNFMNHNVWWVQWPLLGWGLGVLGHAYLAFKVAGREKKLDPSAQNPNVSKSP